MAFSHYTSKLQINGISINKLHLSVYTIEPGYSDGLKEDSKQDGVTCSVLVHQSHYIRPTLLKQNDKAVSSIRQLLCFKRKRNTVSVIRQISHNNANYVIRHLTIKQNTLSGIIQ